MNYDAVIKTPVGKVGIRTDDGSITDVDFFVADRVKDASRSVSGAAVKWLHQYFEDATTSVDLPLLLRGTAFQCRVWSELQKIAPGEVLTYKQLADRLGSAPRAVGQACRNNPCPIIVPCHRVISSAGIGGFAGETEGQKISVKRWLLRHEGVVV